MARNTNISNFLACLRQFSVLRKVSYLSSLGILSSSITISQTATTPSISLAETEPSATTTQLAPSVVIESVPPTMPAPPIEPQQTIPKPPLYQPPVAPPENYAPPNSIVFSERSSGCNMVVQTGRGVTNLCGTPQNTEVRRSPSSQQTLTQPPVLPPTHTGTRARSQQTLTQSPVLPPSNPSLSGRANLNNFNREAASASPNVSKRGYTPTALLQKYYNGTYRPPSRLGNGNIQLIFPLSIPASITSLFGWRIHPIRGDARFHTGTDIGAPLGTPVLAALDGRVAIADWLGGYGMAVALQHGEQGQQQTLYAHLSKIFVQPGEPVLQGEVIGLVGSTGLSTGPHLHFEFRQQTPDGWVALDPGEQLEYGLAQLIQSMQQTNAQPKPQRPPS